MSAMTNKNTKIFAFLFIISSYIIAALAGLWWVDSGEEIEFGIYLIVGYILAYEFGFKLCFQRMSKLCFVLGFLLPSILGTVGFFIGLII